MEQQIFYYFFHYRGHHSKGIAIYTATEENLHKSYEFIHQKVYFWTAQTGSNKKTLFKMTFIQNL